MFHYADAIEGLTDMLGDEAALTHAGVHTSWKDFESRAARLGQAFADAGLKPGSKIGILLYNCPEYYETFLAAVKMRMVPFNINYRYVGDELRYLLDNADCEALVYHRSLGDMVGEVVPGMPKVRLSVQVDDGEGSGWDRSLAYETLIANTAPAPRIPRQDDDIQLMYTGGTTGMPKGVMYELAPWATGVTAMYAANIFGIPTAPNTVAELLQLVKGLRSKGPSPVVLPSSPLMHTAGFFNSVPAQLIGGRCVTEPNKRFDAMTLWRTVARERVSMMIIVGDAFARPLLDALEQGASRGETLDLSSLRIMVSSGVLWSKSVKEKLLEWVDAALVDAVGATEGGMAMQLSRRGAGGVSSQFIALADTRLFAEDGRDIPRDSSEPGMIAAGGAHLPAGYYKDPDKTAKTFRVIDGKRYAFIGDWGQWNPDGSLALLGRGSACINTGGEKVYPEEVEAVIGSHPEVSDSLIVGLPDERFGQKVVALVVPRLAGGGALASALPEFIAGKIAGYKRPRMIFEVDAIPRMPNGKADYKAAKLIAEQRAAAASK